MEADSPTLSVWALSSIGPSLCEGIGASAGTPYAAVGVEAMGSTIISAPSKKPSMGVPMVAETSSVVG